MATITGAISSGTMRTQDLIPTFLSTLDQLDHAEYVKLAKQYREGLANSKQGYDAYYESDACAWLMEALYDALDDCAPDGYYFGAHEGDGACYGFWEV